jgi:hypothetical protein
VVSIPEAIFFNNFRYYLEKLLKNKIRLSIAANSEIVKNFLFEMVGVWL